MIDDDDDRKDVGEMKDQIDKEYEERSKLVPQVRCAVLKGPVYDLNETEVN